MTSLHSCHILETDTGVGNGRRRKVESMGKKGDITKAAILKAALILFVHKGFKNVTMKDICEATGLSRGGFTTFLLSRGTDA